MQTPEEITFWQQKWTDKETPWDLLGAHPYVGRLIELVRQAKPSLFTASHAAYVPACGTAHDAALFAQLGMQVVAEDIVPAAIEAAAMKYSLPNLTLRTGNSLETDRNDIESFDLIYDRAALCAMQPNQRTKFLSSCFAKLRPGGIFSSILFGKISDPLPQGGGPPFAITSVEFLKILGELGNLVAIEERPCATPNTRIHTEVLVVAIK